MPGRPAALVAGPNSTCSIISGMAKPSSVTTGAVSAHLAPSATSTSGWALADSPRQKGMPISVSTRTAFRKPWRHRLRIVLDLGVGAEGDLVDRRHELVHEQLGQEQRGRVDAQQMRIEGAAGDHDVGLGLDEPEQLPDPDDPRRNGPDPTRP